MIFLVKYDILILIVNCLRFCEEIDFVRNIGNENEECNTYLWSIWFRSFYIGQKNQ